MPPSQRFQQRVVPGLGRHYTSPKKNSRHVKGSDKNRVISLGREVRAQNASMRLQQLRAETQESLTQTPAETPHLAEDGGWDDMEPTTEPSESFAASPVEQRSSNQGTPSKRRRVTQNVKLSRFYDRWKALLPQLEMPYLSYVQQSIQKPAPSSFTCRHACTRPNCTTGISQVLILYWDHLETHGVPYCECTPLAVVLVQHGVFPSAPSDPRLAVSIDLLDFYRALFERSGDAVTALSGALRRFYVHRGWRLINEQGAAVVDPFRRGLAHAMQWYDVLRINVERQVDKSLDLAVQAVASYRHETQKNVNGRTATAEHRSPQAPSVEERSITSTSSHTPETTLQCARILQKRCPACFGGRTFGKPVSKGCDIHVAVDANFSHRHLRSAGDGIPFYDPTYIISADRVNAVGDRIEELRKKPKRKYVPKVPDSALDECEHGHEAADEHKVKTADK
ncbi:hypothetical protein NM688_g5508 [Phlebia brevispora]|uniref:Uncharacterized protein n=1 Tax=Phlebia brevispora TaxID=194682 RepID=A0ACC1SUC9_9APHY|nr:hypothetical protein NM688_g5508 [Phlebia brevispora]